MALSGTFDNYVTGNFGLHCEWFAVQNYIENYSDVTLNVYLSYDRLDGGIKGLSKITVNNNTDTYIPADLETSPAGWKMKLLKSKTERVEHNYSGTRTVGLSASYTYYGKYNGETVGTITARETVTLDTIDRKEPQVSARFLNIVRNGFDIDARASEVADVWQYSLDNGKNWTQFSTASGTSAIVKVIELNADTEYDVTVRARKESNQVFGKSVKYTVRTLSTSVIHKASTVIADASQASITANISSCDSSFYHKLVVNNLIEDVVTIDVGQLEEGKQDRTFQLTEMQREALLSHITAKQLRGKILLKTYTTDDCETQVGETSGCSCVFVTTQENSAPLFCGFSCKNTDMDVAIVVSDETVMLQTMSKLLIECEEGIAKNGASIAFYSASICEIDKNSDTNTIDIGTIPKSGDVEITVSCTDSRGWTTNVTDVIKVLPYVKPKLSSCQLKREDEVGRLISFSYIGSFSPIIADGENDTNEIVFVGYRYKATNEQMWSEWMPLTNVTSVSGTTFQYSDNEFIELDENQSFVFQIKVEDRLNSTISELLLTQGTPIIAIRKRNSTHNYPRIGINNPHPKTTLDVAGNISMNGYIVLGYAGEVEGSFNNYREGGYYHYCGEGSYNAPAGAGLLEVFVGNSGNLIQRFTEYASGAATYVRTLCNNTWTPWSTK